MAVDLNSTSAICQSALEAHENLILRCLDGVKAAAARADHLDWLGKFPHICLYLIHFNDLFEHASLDQQVLVGEEADVLENAKVIKGNRAVDHMHRLRKVIEPI